MKKKQFIITKNQTSSNYTTSEYYDTTDVTDFTYTYTNDSDTDTNDTVEVTSQSKIKTIKVSNSKKKSKSLPKKQNFTSIVTSTYKKPKEGSVQDNYKKDDIIKQLKGFIPLRSMEEKKILTQLPIFKSWIKYINLDTKQFRVGGFLMKVDYPKYITLANTRTNVSWSVQLNNTIIYIRDPRKQETTIDDTDTYYTDTYTYNESTNTEIDMIKDKLYQLYLKGQLTTKK
jgi:hypothetical protein